MVITEYNEEETMNMFKRDYYDRGQSNLAETIKSIKSGITESELLASGISQDTIDLAKSCL